MNSRCRRHDSRRRVARELGAGTVRKIERWLGAYAVVAEDDAVVTVGFRR